MTADAPPRVMLVAFVPEWDPAGGTPARRGLFATDARVRTLLRVLLSYSEVRHVLPDRISLDAAASPPLLETIARFLDRQHWLVDRVTIA
jgi:hypothetical protein